MANKQKAIRKERVAQRKGAKRNRTIITWAAIVGFIGILAYVTWSQMGDLGNSLPAESVADPWLGAAPQANEGSGVSTEAVAKPSEAEVVEIVEFADFGCPACRSWHNLGIREQVLAEFGDKVRFVWKDFPIITPQSPQAAEAGQCASAQGKFWEYHDYFYENHLGLGRAELEGYAEATGLDLDLFNQCLDDRTMALKVQANEQAARRFGIRGTPGFTVNGRNLGGPPSYDMLLSIINQELAQTN